MSERENDDEVTDEAAWDVFIAYPSAERGVAARIADALRTSASVFLDFEQIQPGDNWDEALLTAVSSARVIVMVVAPSSNRAYFQRDELLRALDRGRRDSDRATVIPVYVGGVTPEDSRVPYGLRPKQGIVLGSDADLSLVQDAVVRRLSDVRQVAAEARGFSPSIRQHMARIQCEVATLTEDQYRLIQYMRPMRRVRVSGCAGSGKTLVAAEKAVRLASAGLSVLFLCHNPLLAGHLAGLVGHSSARVLDFASWLSSLRSAEWQDGLCTWTHFSEPTADELHSARCALRKASTRYDAIVVDEGQDFRSEWWAVIEEALLPGPAGQMYIFHDNNQSLLPHRGEYPIAEPHLDLSRNCRNAGRVFELMRFYDSGAPEPERRLLGAGRVELTPYRAGDEAIEVSRILRSTCRELPPENVVVLWAGAEPIGESPLANLEVTVPVTSPWQHEVRWQFRNAPHTLPRVGLAPPASGWSWISEQLEGLSDEPYPTPDDVALVRAVAERISVYEARPAGTEIRTSAFRWAVSDNRLYLRRRGVGAMRTGEVIVFFRRESWHSGIPQPQIRRVVPFHLPQTGTTLPLYSVSDFKGLEADAVILVMRGRNISHRESTYVGISRARTLLSVLADEVATAELPKGFRWDDSRTAA